MGKSFASDNNTPVHPKIMQAVMEANRDDYVSYGDDPYTRRAEEQLKQTFGPEAHPFLVFTGTAANVLGLSSVLRPFHAVIAPATSHINVDECGALENITGSKLLTVSTPDGKLNPSHVRPLLHALGVEHHAQPRVISITQPTELGTVYSPREIKDLAAFAHENGLYLHMDGARLANAAAFLHTSLKSITADAGVDILSFGGTKNGMMFGESVILFNREAASSFPYLRKQGMQLGSKMRYLAAQFIAYLNDGLWLKNAEHANAMARILAEKAALLPGVEIFQPVETNGVFLRLPRQAIPLIQEKSFFYIWDEEADEVRWMTSYDTTPEDIEAFVALAADVIKDVSENY
ncbi:MAG TPA: low specificity L-threonine aldolase [Candidatus Mcinerneyibacteriales bacterium]|nr:low specificity L-threonine aldolase [Candidatus Mcinerneyibacteriales bacterium]